NAPPKNINMQSAKAAFFFFGRTFNTLEPGKFRPAQVSTNRSGFHAAEDVKQIAHLELRITNPMPYGEKTSGEWSSLVSGEQRLLLLTTHYRPGLTRWVRVR